MRLPGRAGVGCPATPSLGSCDRETGAAAAALRWRRRPARVGARGSAFCFRTRGRTRDPEVALFPAGGTVCRCLLGGCFRVTSDRSPGPRCWSGLPGPRARQRSPRPHRSAGSRSRAGRLQGWRTAFTRQKSRLLLKGRGGDYKRLTEWRSQRGDAALFPWRLV